MLCAHQIFKFKEELMTNAKKRHCADQARTDGKMQPSSARGMLIARQGQETQCAAHLPQEEASLLLSSRQPPGQASVPLQLKD